MKIFEDLVSCEGYLGRRSTALASPSSPGEELSSDEVSKINVTKSIGGGATSALPLVPDAETECDAALRPLELGDYSASAAALSRAI